MHFIISTYQGLFQRLKRAGVQHFLLDFGRVWAPGHQEQLLLLGALCCPLRERNTLTFDTLTDSHLALVLVLEVVQPVATLALPGRLQVGEELLVAGVSPPQLLHCDELLVLDEEDTVAVARGVNIISILLT